MQNKKGTTVKRKSRQPVVPTLESTDSWQLHLWRQRKCVIKINEEMSSKSTVSFGTDREQTGYISPKVGNSVLN